MKLTKLKVETFKRVKSIELDLADVNILVGSNGSGKSSIIQATHLACCMIRQAERVVGKATATVGVDELDYLPSNSYKLLAHKAEWGNRIGTPSSKVAFSFDNDGIELSASCELRSARNAGISITGNVPSELKDILRTDLKFFSAYIPGISGIPNREEKRSKKVILKACSYGDSNIILRNALLVLKEQDQQNIHRIQDWISEIVEPLKITVEHEDDKDLSITCSVKIGKETRPIELIGTGYLQLIQIFSYILLFEPGILLIDEPDIHLHPTVQEKLVRVLSKVAQERGLKILLTTHSPFIVRGASSDTNVYWVSDGQIESKNRRTVELALGWGAFGKKVIVVSEDHNTELLKKIISQWPSLEQSVAFLPSSGYRSLPTPDQSVELASALGGKFKILVHRDRDSLTDVEVDGLQKEYAKRGVFLWITDFADIEAYFCQPAFLKSFLGCSDSDANAHVDRALITRKTETADIFKSHRANHNKELHSAGGSPSNDEVMGQFQNRAIKGMSGKTIFKELQNIPGGHFRVESIVRHSISPEVASSLRIALQGLCK